MELGSILQFLENRSILVTGATGFLAKIFIEKVLRVQPQVKKLYLLLRASDTNSAMQRFNNEIMEKELFKVLKEKNGEKLSSLISEKVRVVAGDISFENLGVKDSHLLEEMLSEIDVVLNLAATTNFDERYDVSFGINTLGARNVLDFSKECDKLKIMVHMSTAYVCGDKEGLVLERPHIMGETLNGTRGLDIDTEKKLIEETLNHLEANNSSQDSIKSAMKDLGLERARKFGWPNTYVFTKAVGEMVLGELKEEIPLVIIRPTIVTSTFKEPFPGWAEGFKTIDTIIIGYGKGTLTCLPADPTTIVDAIPADMVVNAIVVAMVANANQGRATDNLIYHMGSSVSNPVKLPWLQNSFLRYFTAHPRIDRNGNPVTVKNFTNFHTMQSYQRYMNIRYFLPLQGLQVLNTVSCQYFQKFYQEQRRKIKFAMRLMELYAPYLFFKGVFNDMNMEKLRRAAAEESGVETDIFYFDPKSINWDDYFINTHIPGVVKRNNS